MLCLYRDEKAFDKLVLDMVSHELALQTVLENAELLVFASSELPLRNWSEFKLLLLKKLLCIYVMLILCDSIMHKITLFVELIDFCRI